MLRGHAVDGNGIRVTEALAGAGLVYVTPGHQSPTSVTMTVDRRLSLLSAAERHDFLIEETGLRRLDGLLVAVVAIFIELVLRETILLRHHFGARELAELDVRVTLFHVRALVDAEAVLERQRDRHAHRHARHAFDTGGDDDIHRARHDGLRAEVKRLLRGTALTVDRRRRHAFRQTAREHRVARNVHALLARLVDAAHDHVFDQLGVDARALHEILDHLAAHIGGVPVLEFAALAAAGGAGGGDDIGFSHDELSLIGSASPARGGEAMTLPEYVYTR